MKVTVCFGPVKIIVPCGDGALTVQDLIEKSIQRYRKALGKVGPSVMVGELTINSLDTLNQIC